VRSQYNILCFLISFDRRCKFEHLSMC
jgi:hypothetical protein